MVTRQIPAKTETFANRTFCDICKSEIEKNYYGNVSYVEISYTSGISYPEGGRKEKKYYDMCPQCFESQLVPFLSSLGMNSYDEDYDW